MIRELVIGSDIINDDADCYVIAEIGHNHQGDINKAKEMFLAAKECGAKAVPRADFLANLDMPAF